MATPYLPARPCSVGSNKKFSETSFSGNRNLWGPPNALFLFEISFVLVNVNVPKPIFPVVVRPNVAVTPNGYRLNSRNECSDITLTAIVCLDLRSSRCAPMPSFFYADTIGKTCLPTTSYSGTFPKMTRMHLNCLTVTPRHRSPSAFARRSPYLNICHADGTDGRKRTTDRRSFFVRFN